MTRWLNLAKDSVSTLASPSFDRVQAFVEQKSSLSMVLEDGEMDQIESGLVSGVGLSADRGQNTNFFCFSSPSDCKDELDNLPDLLEVKEPSESIGWEEPSTHRMPVQNTLDGEPHQSKADRLLEADNKARAFDDRIEQVRVTYSEKNRHIDVIDREGWIRSEPQQYVNFRVFAIASENGRRERGYSRLAGYQGEDLFQQKTPEEVATKAASRAITALKADPIAPGPKTVVIASGFGGTIFHEACGHGFEADHIYEDVSRYAGRMGDTVASDKVTFVDNGSLENKYGSFRIDDEGVPSQRNVLIRDGVMTGVMSDRKHADLLGRQPTGNGRRESFNYPVLPRMTNTYIEAGNSDAESIIESTEEGIYAAHIGGGQVDPASGDFIFSITEGYRIEHGKITTPIRDAALVGNGPDVLHRIDAVGDDLELRPGVCGKGQWVPVTVGQPTLRVRELTVGGQD